MKKLLTFMSTLTIFSPIVTSVSSCKNMLDSSIKQDLNNFKINNVDLNRQFYQSNVDLLNNIILKIAIKYNIDYKDFTNYLDSNKTEMVICFTEADGTEFSNQSNDHWYELADTGKVSVEIKTLKSNKYFKEIDKTYNFNLSVEDKRFSLDEFELTEFDIFQKNPNAYNFIRDLERFEIQDAIKINPAIYEKYMDANIMTINVNFTPDSGGTKEFNSGQSIEELQNILITNGKADIIITLDKKDPFFIATNDKRELKDISVKIGD